MGPCGPRASAAMVVSCRESDSERNFSIVRMENCGKKVGHREPERRLVVKALTAMPGMVACASDPSPQEVKAEAEASRSL